MQMTRWRGLFFPALLATLSLATYVLVLLLPEDQQSGLTSVLVILSVVFAFAWCMPATTQKDNGRMDPFHPAALFMVFYLVYFVFSGMLVWLQHDYSSLWVNTGKQSAYYVNSVFFLGIISVAAFGLGVRTESVLFGEDILKFFYSGDSLHLREIRYFIYLFFIVGLTFTIYHLSMYGPLSIDILRYLSPSAQRELTFEWSQAFVILESMLNWSVLLAIFHFVLRYVETGRKDGAVITILFFSVVMVIIYVISGKRSAVIPLLLLPLLWRHYLVKQLSVVTAGVFLAISIVIIGVMLLGRIVVPLLMRDLNPTDYLGDDIGQVMLFYFDTGEWSTFDMVLASVVQRDELLSAMGGAAWGFLKYTFGTLIIFIPRAIWADKPGYEDPGHIYYQILSGENEAVGFAVTAWGTSFLFFHVVGVLLGMFVLGWFCRWVYNILRPCGQSPYNVFFYSIFYWMMFQFLRFGTMGFTFLVFIQSMFVGVLAGLVLARKKQRVTSAI
jgi:oligosaccharide repeat unit polymerase